MTKPTQPPHPLLERLLSADPSDVDMFEGMEEDLGALLEQLVDPTSAPTPSPDRRADLMGATSPYGRFTERIAGLFQVGVDVARRYVGQLIEPSSWHMFQPGCSLMHVAGGPALAAADVGFVSVKDGHDFPHHLHEGVETSIVLEGVVVEDTGKRYRPGDMVVNEPGSSHGFRAEGDVLFAVVVFGVRFDEELQRKLHG